MQKIKQYHARSAPTDLEYRVVWLSCFTLMLPTLIFKRLLPTHWSRWKEGHNPLTAFREAKNSADMLTPMMYQGY